MEAKDTVMKPNQIVEAMSEWKDDNGIAWEDWNTVMTKQAEISFKAGKQVGIKEVVDWIKTNSSLFIAGRDIEKLAGSNNREATSYYPIIKYLDWQAKLKEWGI